MSRVLLAEGFLGNKCSELMFLSIKKNNNRNGLPKAS